MSDVEKNIGTHKPGFEGEWVPISQVYDLQMGKTPSRDIPEYWNNGEHDWVSIKDLGSYEKYVGKTNETISELGRVKSGIKSVPANTLLMSFKLSLGKTAITTKETYTNEAIMAFLDKGTYDFDIDYMWHQLQSKDWTVGTNTAVMGKTLNKKTLSATKIRVPSISEQKEIAKHLDVVQETLSLLSLELKTLDDLVKSQFVEMFGGYGADSEYRCARLGKLLSVEPQNGLYKPQRYYRTDCGGTPIVRVDAFSDGSVFSYASLKRLDCSESELENYALHEGDIVMNRVNGSIERVGKVALIKGLDEATVYESNMMRFHVDESRLNVTYIVHVLCSDDIRKQIKSCARIANQCSVNQENIAGLQIPLPPLALQRQFADFVARVDKLGFDCCREIVCCGVLFSSMSASLLCT